MNKDRQDIQPIVNSCIFHYTNVATLIGMLKNASTENAFMTFWASHISYMNDPEEKKYGMKKIWEVLSTVEDELDIPSEQRIKNLEQKELDKFIKILSTDENSVINTYAISFSESYDYLPMWKMYGQDGNGICLGFDETILNKYLKENHMGEIVPVRYGIGEDISDIQQAQKDMEDWESLIKKAYKNNYDYYSKAFERKSTNPDKDKTIALYTYVTLLATIPQYIKNPAYEYEKECRLCCGELRQTVHFRNQNGLLLPYLEIKLPLNALKIITTGPTTDSERQMISIVKLLKEKYDNWENITYYSSDIPYRP